MPAAADTSPALTGLRVLVVEDEMLVAMMLEEILLKLGCEVVGAAARVTQALAALDGEPVDLAVLDVNLGGEKVFPVAEALAGRGIPFLFSTGYGTSGLRDGLSSRTTLQKPVDEAVLEQMITAELRVAAADAGDRRARTG